MTDGQGLLKGLRVPGNHFHPIRQGNLLSLPGFTVKEWDEMTVRDLSAAKRGFESGVGKPGSTLY